MTGSPPPPPLPGDVVGPYRLEDLLGVGGMATVYRAVLLPPEQREADDRDVQTDATDEGQPDAPVVALKILHPGKADTDDMTRFKREFLTLSGMDHSGVVRVYRAGLHGDYPWIALEYIDGMDLGSLLKRWEVDPPADRFTQAEALLRGICSGLAYIHEHGLIHRDLKPSNVLLTQSLDPKLTDFGVVKAPGAFSTQLTRAGMLVGTVAFMAPEQIQGDAIDSRADLYSLGAILYILLTGRRPIEADDIIGYLSRHLHSTPTTPSEIDPRVPARLERICMKLLRKDPSQRYASARQVVAALEEDDGGALPVHGFDGLFQALDQHMGAVREGEGGVVVLQGGAGSGKTAALHALVEQARGHGQDVAASHGMALDPLAELMSQIPVRQSEADGLDAVQRIAVRTQGRPWVLVMDDFDHLPDAERADLSSLVRDRVAVRGEALLLICGINPEHDDRVSNELGTGALTGLSPTVLDVPRLDRSAVMALVRDRGLGGAAGAALGQRLLDELGGQPGAILDQLDALVRAGWLVADDEGHLRATRGVDALREESLPVGDRVRSQESGRLDGLAEAPRAVLNVLAVLGMDAAVDLVVEVSGREARAVSQALDQLETEGLVRQWVEGVTEMSGMAGDTNDPLRTLIYETMPLDQRAAWHRGAATALQRRSRRRVDTIAEVVAGHLLHGGEVGAAYPMLLSAARRRLRSGKLEEARSLLRRALDARAAAEGALEPAEVQRCRELLHGMQGEIHTRLGDLERAEEAWKEALAAGTRPDAVARARAGLGLVRAERGEFATAAEDLAEAVDSLPQGDPLWPRVARALAVGRTGLGALDAAEEIWTRLAEHSRDTGAASLAAEAQGGLAVLTLAQGALEPGRAALEDAVFRLRATTRTAPLVQAMVWLAELALADGRLVEAADRAAQADQAARVPELAALRLRAMATGALAHRGLGDKTEAEALARDAAGLVASRALPLAPGTQVALAAVARALVVVDQGEGALSVLAGLRVVDAPGLESPGALVWAGKALALLRADPAGAGLAARRSMAMQHPMLPWLGARAALDAATVMVDADAPRLQEAVRLALRRVETRGLQLQRLEAERLAVRAGLGDVYNQRAAATFERLLAGLGGHEGFQRAWGA